MHRSPPTLIADLVDQLAIGDPEIVLAIGYAPRSLRAGLTTLFALDARLGRIVSAARDPTLSQLRLAWWRDALQRLDTNAAPPEPLLRAVSAHLRPAGITGTALATLVDGWELLIAADTPNRRGHAAARGRLFIWSAALLGATDDRLEPAGEGWALVDLARRQNDATALVLAQPMLDGLFRRRWPQNLRAIGALTAIAHADVVRGRPGTPGAPRRVLRMLWHRITGR